MDGNCDFSRPHLPPTPDSPLNPTILPHVKGHIPALPITPLFLNEACSPHSAPTSALLTGLNVLQHTTLALENLHRIYATSQTAQSLFEHCVRTISQGVKCGGRLIVCGVGKSAKIGHKLVATATSMRVRSQFLHAAEALHGDLGMIDAERDTLLMITFSARTPELMALKPHIPVEVPLVVLTGWTSTPAVPDCPLFSMRSDARRNILLPAPIPVSEEEAFGVRVPTISTTVALALCDSVAMAVATELHGGRNQVEEVFRDCHPGGDIGKNDKNRTV
ncbi:MAG: hypothetical protein MMC23_004995 [Stictis urceolatum]|nr:hypothetical protein [Stictis urceolata]